MNLNKLLIAGKVVFSAIILLTVSACSSSSSDKKISCGCLDYFPQGSVDTTHFSEQIISDTHYQTSGATFCTGLKGVDVINADKSAKENLAKMLSARVDTKESLRTATPGYGVVIEEYKQDTNIESNLTLKEAFIIHRWVDKASCSVYSSAKISKKNAESSIKSVEESLHNSTFYLAKSGSQTVDNTLFDYFVSEGINKIDKKDKEQRYLVEASIADIKQKSNKELTLILNLKITDRKKQNVFTSLSPEGKGISFKSKSRSELYKRALEDALYELKPLLHEALAK